LETIGDDFEFGFTSNTGLVPKSFANSSVVRFEFQTKLPWALNTREPN